MLSLSGKDRQQMLEALESTMHTRLPPEMEIRSSLHHEVFSSRHIPVYPSQLQQRRDLLGLPSLLAGNRPSAPRYNGVSRRPMKKPLC